MFCYKCGSEIMKNAKFCYKCGNKVYFLDEAIEDNSEEKRYKKIEFKLGNNKVIYDNGMCEYIEIRCLFEREASRKKILFMEWYDEKINNFDDFIKYPLDKIEELISKQVQYGVEVLLKKGIDYVDEVTLMGEIIENGIQNEFLLYTTAIIEIIDRQKSDIEKRKYRQMLRGSRWSGGGFGIQGAIKGSIEASIMNMGSKALGAIPEALNKIMNDADVESMKRELMRNSEVYASLVEGMYDLLCKVFYCVEKYLVLEEKLIYYDEKNIHKIELARLRNYMNLYNNGGIRKVDVMEKVADGLGKCPFHLHFYRDLYILDKGLDSEIYQIAVYTGSEYEYEAWVKRIDEKK